MTTASSSVPQAPRWGRRCSPALARLQRERRLCLAPILLCALSGAVHAAGTIFSTVLRGSGQDFALAATSDAQGNTYVAGLTYSADFPVTAGAFQTTFGGTCDAWIAKAGPDGKLLWSTYLGGILDDWATGIALDSAGNVLVAGYTRSANFPLDGAIESTLTGDDYAAFVAKLDPTGSKLLYSTFLGGADLSGAAGIAVDAAGSAYVAVNVNSATGYPGTVNAPNQYGIFVSKLNSQGALVYSFFHPTGTAGGIALDTAGSVYVTGTYGEPYLSARTQDFGEAGTAQAFVFKVSPDGSQKVYETVLGGSVQTVGAAIAVDSAGEAWVAGSTSSADFPLVKPLERSPGARPLWQSADSGTTWAPMDNLPFALPQVMLTDPTRPATLYIATGDLGLFKSQDAGATWANSSSGIAAANITALAVDPFHPQTLYTATAPAAGATSSTVYKSVDGAESWAPVDSPAMAISQLAVDAQNPNIVWEIGAGLRKSTDGGVTWNAVTFPGTVDTMLLDPRVSGNLFAISNPFFCGPFCGGTPPYFYRSVDGGADWIQGPLPAQNVSGLYVDGSTNPSTVYDGLFDRSVDGGVTWTSLAPPAGSSGYVAAAVDPTGTLYAAVDLVGNYVSKDHAQTWTPIGSFISPPTNVDGAAPAITSIVPAGTTGTLYAIINQVASAGFLTKLSADGASILFSTYLRGHASMESFVSLLAEPSVFMTQSWISAIALDSAGNATVAGGTRATDFPIANPAQAASAGLADAFVATVAADGSKLTYSTYFGGSGDDGALAVALDTQGNAIFAGQTFSGDFPVPGGSPLPYTYGDAFVVKVATGPPVPPVVTSVLNGASFQPGIEAGSWVMIKGANLANTVDLAASGNLPTSLDGVSVSIDGIAAFVDYISPTQINVQAPSDTALGPVSVVVTNNGAVSAPAMAQLQAAAPAFFLYSGTNYAVASRLPDYAPVGDPSAPAKPGDALVLWGTGFGATSPAVAAGTVVAGAPAVVTAPTVTIGGMAVPVVDTILTAGSAGLYQITIQLPANIPTGAVAVQASVGGVPSPAGVTIFVGTP